MEIVLDTSIVLKWFLPEDESSKARYLREKHLKNKIVICAPQLLIFEIVNALVYKKELSLSNISLVVEILFFTNLKFFDCIEELIQETAKIARRYEITVYDASYVALAKALSCKFITADKKLFNKIKTLKFVKLLK